MLMLASSTEVADILVVLLAVLSVWLFFELSTDAELCLNWLIPLVASLYLYK